MAPPVVGRPAARHAQVVIAVASMGFFLITLDISIVNVALVQIRAELGGGTVGQQWVIDGYTLLFAALLLFAGNLSDRIGAKKAMALGIALFGLTSAACAFAPSAALLIAARCAQGAAAAVMLPASMALVREAFPDPARRARALGVWAVGGAVAALVGQPLGGLLTTVDWRWVFTINLPVCAAMLVLLRAVAPSPTRPAPFDWAGQVLAVVGLSTLVYGLIDGGHAGFGSPPVVAALTVAVLALAGFVLVQARVRHPMVPLDLFRARGVRLALPVGFAFMVGNYGHVFVVSLFLQQELGLSPLRAGLVFLPAAVFAIVANLASGPVTNRLGARLPVVAGLTSMAVGLTAMLLVAPLGHPLLIAACVIPVGAGGALAMPSVTGVVLEGVPAQQAGTASAVFNTFRQVGGAVAIAVFGALIADPDQVVPGLRLSLGIAAGLLVLAAVSSLRIPPRRDPST
ncbi:MFS transporter [Microlunatus capsulatus]|uniref:DHA2 family methylenomycin A resistance protein-like MFS transporter n=1 Tax=Microlunatus capsulatus TaxID=99117 RepID=A0ABS4Z7C6_9ACTN|nr:MFS transporter [Microlunatus capsulatus]MBP2416864.1 DHA2 family methylenomycin A resistance protein-like MFS transporter [Microlunatus capsulatus]